MKRVARSTVVENILSSNGRFFTVLFKKRKSGSLRMMNCKLNYDILSKQLEKGLIPVYETGVGYRNIPAEGIVLVSVNKKTLRVK